MAEFDPDKYLAASKPAETGFDPDKYLSETKPKQEKPGIADQLLSILPKEGDSFNQGAVGGILESQPITDEELDKISQASQLSKEQRQSLRDAVEWYGGMHASMADPTVPTSTKLAQAGKQILGKGGKILSLGGLAQKLDRASQSDPKMEQALDNLMATLEEKQSYLMMAADIFGLGGVIGKAATKLPTIAAISTGESVAASKSGEELKAAGFGATVGVVADRIGPVLGRAKKVLGKNAAKTIDDSLEESMGVITQKAEAAFKAAKPEIDTAKNLIGKFKTKSFTDFIKSIDNDTATALLKVSKDKPADTKAFRKLLKINNIPVTDESMLAAKAYSNALDIAESLGAKSEKGGIEELTRVYDTNKLKGMYDDAMLAKAAKDAASTSKASIEQWSPITGFIQRTISDGKPLFQSLDKKLGLSGNLSIEEAAGNISNKLDILKTYSFPAKQKLTKLNASARKDGYSPEEISDLLEAGKTDGVIGEYRKLIDSFLDTAKEVGINIEKKTDYVPKLRKSALAYRAGLIGEIVRLGKQFDANLFNPIDDSLFLALKEDKAGSLLLSELKNVGGFAANSADELTSVLNKVRVNDKALADSMAEMEATAAFRRDDSIIPEWARERNINRLLSRSLDQTLKVGLIQQDVKRLQNAAEIALEAGDSETSRYLLRLVGDITGGKKPVAEFGESARATMERYQSYLLRKANSKEPGIERTLARGQASLVQSLPALTNNIYSSYISRPYHMLMNVMSPATQIGPELGRDGFDIVGKAYSDIYRNYNKTVKELADRGLHGPQWKGEDVRAVREALYDTGLSRTSATVNEKVANMTLAGFAKSEELARVLAYKIGQKTTDKLIAKPEFATRFINQLASPNYKRRIAEAVKSGDKAKLEKVVTDYFNAEHLFKYDKVHMAEYARVMGPMFSIFTKWPTSMAGKVMTNYRNKSWDEASKRLAQIYLAPFAVLQGIDTIARIDNSEDPRTQKLFGRKGLSNLAPADAFFQLVGEVAAGDPLGGLTSSPITQLAKPFSQIPKAKSLGAGFVQALDRTYDSFGPGAGALKIIGQDIPAVLGAKRLPYKSVTESVIKPSVGAVGSLADKLKSGDK